MSDTPKRNEAVAWAVVVDGTPDYASVHKYACDSEASVYGTGPTVTVEPLYSQEQMDALRGEVSRLRGLLSDTAGNLRRMANDEFADCEKVRLEAVLERIETNLEPPTNGR